MLITASVYSLATGLLYFVVLSVIVVHFSPQLVRVEATVIEQTLSHTYVQFWFRRRESSKSLKCKFAVMFLFISAVGTVVHFFADQFLP